MNLKVIYIVLSCFVFVSNPAQNLDTITNNYSPPAVLDILSKRSVVENKSRPKDNPPQVEVASPKKRNNIRRKE